jgi:hypothetical protein
MGSMKRPILAVAACAAMVFASWAVPPARAQDSMSQRLSMDRLAAIQPGAYMAGDSVRFVLIPANGAFLLRVQDSPEIYILYADHASLGGRILRYDSGETAIQVAVWGGITLYTDAQPGGLPAVRIGDAGLPSPPLLGTSDMQNATADEAQHLGYSRHLQLAFNVDWNGLGDGYTRAYAFDALQNAGRGIERFASSPAGRDAVAHRIDTVTLAPTGGRPGVNISGRMLVVYFNSSRGFAGCASSRVIARQLYGMLAPRR